MHIRRMIFQDIPAGVRLSEQAGWNQLPQDWARQFELEPEGCFVAEDGGQVIGTACACVFDDVAWVNLVLVDEMYRKKGIGTRLMLQVMKFLEDRDVRSVRLDATPLGQPIYEKLGFVEDYRLIRFHGVLSTQNACGAGIRAAEDRDLPGLYQLDLRITGTPRAKLLAHMAPRIVERDGEVIAYAGCRPGRSAWHIGPCMGDLQACFRILSAIHYFIPEEPAIMDVPKQNDHRFSWHRGVGLEPQRELIRMTYGRSVQEQLDEHWCCFGPEKG
ncbi:MAG: GNAT family N-acetyltransferase [Gemmataceae bacterium]|nr:GNAT family N-acetyltransferase [Gemmataceae bacterium]MCI0737517.1 GNAT family N-acetyltransferase [Gemmataceae bacterium]